jgi:L-lactate dehydrogenase complex protein LldG
MTAARAEILENIRKGRKRGPLDAAQMRALKDGLERPKSYVVPQRGQVPEAERIELFVKMAQEVGSTIARLEALSDLVGVVRQLTAANGLAPNIALAPSPELTGLDWNGLSVRRGPARPEDQVSVVPAFAGIAETGTLMLLSSPESPTTLNFMPDYHVVLIKASRILGTFEEAWAILRKEHGPLPRTVNLITGPSRTGDIEQTILMGAHGPRRLIVALAPE